MEIIFQEYAACSGRMKCWTASLESVTSTDSWQVMAFHPNCHGLGRGRGMRALILCTGLSKSGSRESYSCFSDVRGWLFSLSTGEKWRVVTPGQCRVFGQWCQQVSGGYSYGQQFWGGERGLKWIPGYRTVEVEKKKLIIEVHGKPRASLCVHACAHTWWLLLPTSKLLTALLMAVGLSGVTHRLPGYAEVLPSGED